LFFSICVIINAGGWAVGAALGPLGSQAKRYFDFKSNGVASVDGRYGVDFSVSPNDLLLSNVQVHCRSDPRNRQVPGQKNLVVARRCSLAMEAIRCCSAPYPRRRAAVHVVMWPRRTRAWVQNHKRASGWLRIEEEFAFHRHEIAVIFLPPQPAIAATQTSITTTQVR
jgi:hypothetical protein